MDVEVETKEPRKIKTLQLKRNKLESAEFQAKWARDLGILESVIGLLFLAGGELLVGGVIFGMGSLVTLLQYRQRSQTRQQVLALNQEISALRASEDE